MFTLKSLLFLCLTIHVVSGNQMLDDCKSETKISEDEFSEIKSRNLKPLSQNQKCFAGCMLRKMNVIINGTLLASELYKLTKDKYNDETKFKMAIRITNGCAEKVQSITDECEIGGIMIPCIWGELCRVGLTRCFQNGRFHITPKLHHI